MTSPPPPPTRLIILRHAKSAWPDVADHERPLAPRGRKDAPVAGQWLHAAGCVPDLVVCSTARRTRETWELVAPELGTEPPVAFDPQVYDADLAELIEVVRGTPDERRALLLIGHQPGVQDLALALAGDAAGDALVRAQEKFPTCAIAVLALPDTWSALTPGTARLTHFTVPRARKRR